MQNHRFENYLSIITGNSDQHARLLNTFSFLEYIGFRKIVKSQPAETMSIETLSHAVEEGRHALFFKRLSVRIGGKKFDNYQPKTLLCGEEAKDYFQNLDRYCESALADLVGDVRPRLTYLYVTWLIEVRALDVYGTYQKTSPVLLGLLKEEKNHLQSVETELRNLDPQFDSRVMQFKLVEQRLFESFVGALQREIGDDREIQYVDHS